VNQSTSEKKKMKPLSRRDFLKLSVAGFGALIMPKFHLVSASLPEFPTGERLGRLFATYDILSKPDVNATIVNTLYQDNVINIYREVLGTSDSRLYRSKTWYETDGGYIYAPNVQPVKNLPNTPISNLPTYGETPGFWAEVSIPYVELQLDGDAPKSPLLQELAAAQQPFRFYYSQVLWIDNVRTLDDGTVQYHVIEKHGSYGDKFWADARAFMPMTPEDLSSIGPDVPNKKIVVDVDHQCMSAYEGNREVFYASVSTGAKFNSDGKVVDAWATPVGDYHVVNRKYISLHMAGGSAASSGYEDFAVSYTSIFASGGVSFHSTYWHNAWGNPMSHGCVNMKPEEAKFIYRWTQPGTPYFEGKYEQDGYAGTNVQVVEY
jgi:lipoprotein-anchoring transpeptidase ErfK/SrfK